MRKTWSGVLSFGMVSVPVGIGVAQSKNDVSFNLLHRECGSRISLKKFCGGGCGELQESELIKGYEASKGRYVMVEDSILESVENEASRDIEVLEFVPASQIDPILIERTYYLIPEKGSAAEKAYALFHGALKRANVGAVVRFVRLNKENLGFVSAEGGSLLLHTLFYADEIRSGDEIVEIVNEAAISGEEEKLADQLVTALVKQDFDHAAHENGHRARLKSVLADLAEGVTVEVKAEQKKAEPVIDLMDSLRASIAATKSKKTTRKKVSA